MNILILKKNKFLIKKLLPDHFRNDSPNPTEMLSFCECIFGIRHIYWHFYKTTLLVSHFIDELGTVLHTVHGQVNLFYCFEFHHSKSIMRICEPDSTDKKCKKLSTEERKSAEKRYVRMSSDDKSGTENEIKWRIFVESFNKNWQIFNMMLSVRIESHHVANAEFIAISTNIFKPRFKRRTSTTIERMMNDVKTRKLWQYFHSIILGTVVHDENMRKTGTQNRLYNRSNAWRFVIGSYQKDNLRRFNKMWTSRSDLHFLVHRTISYDSLRVSIFKRISSFSRNFSVFIYGHAD